jgi:Ran GTPase-activating protein (RanGAP) involved in mRNA processing and transport
MAEYFARVVPSLQFLEKLVLVNVDNGDIDNESEKQLFPAVGKLTYLKELKLTWCTITQAAADSLAEVLPSLQLLEKLVMRCVQCAYIDDESEKQLFTAVGKLTYLKELDFLTYKITRAGSDSLAEVLPSLQLLEKLLLTNDYGGDAMDDLNGKQLFDAVGKLTYLKKLKFGGFMITRADADTLDEVLPSLQLLEKLVLYRVGFESAKQLFATIGKLTYLKKLKLNYCTITQADADSLAEVLRSLQLLEKLSLNSNDFTNINDHQLFSAVGSLSCLKELHLCHIEITNAGAEILIDVLPSLRNLICIKLNGVREPLKSRLVAAACQVPGLKER